MQDILIEEKERNDNGWVFGVGVGGSEYTVTVVGDYYQKLTDGKIGPGELVRRSFEFLLARESKEAILKKFDLSIIQKYFPEYEGKMKNSVE